MGLPLTVYGVGRALELNPEAARAFAAAGHEVASHAWRWIDYHGMDEATERAEIARCVETIERLTGTRPVGWYTGRISPNTRRLVAEHGGFLYDSDAYDDDLPHYVTAAGKPHLVIPYTLDNNDMKYAVPPGFGDPAGWERHLTDAFEVLLAEGRAGGAEDDVGRAALPPGRPARARRGAAALPRARGAGEGRLGLPPCRHRPPLVGHPSAAAIGEPPMSYPLENRELVAEAPGLRMQILTLAAGQEVPWHWHSEVTDTFWCMEGPMVIETRAPNESGRARPRADVRRAVAPRASRDRQGWRALPLRHPAGCRHLRLQAGGRVMRRRSALALPLLLAARGAAAQDGRRLELIVPYPPGGGNDIGARALAPLLERELGMAVVVLNRPGAGSQIGMAQVARARPDGLTIGYGLWPQTTTLYLDACAPGGLHAGELHAARAACHRSGRDLGARPTARCAAWPTWSPRRARGRMISACRITGSSGMSTWPPSSSSGWRGCASTRCISTAPARR